MSEYYPPRYQSKHFHCPYCQVYASQRWVSITAYDDYDDEIRICIEKADVEISICSHCESTTFWLTEKIIYPPTRSAPQANGDLPDNVKQVYEEAASIADQSARAACALLRLAVEMLLEHLGGTGNLNTNIKKLVEKDLIKQEIQQSLDIVRVIGNNAVHDGKIIFDDTTHVQGLFNLINVIAEFLITRPKQTKALYARLPQESKEAIEKRDGKTE